MNFVYNGANQIACLDGGGNGVCGDPDDIAYSYDAYGNLTNDGIRTCAYDAGNRLIGVSDGISTTNYSYNLFMLFRKTPFLSEFQFLVAINLGTVFLTGKRLI